MSYDIEIICPKCSRKAAFYAPKIVKYSMLIPAINGKAICNNCGLNKEHQFTQKDYYYSIPIGNRFLYARTMENLKILLTYFKEDRRLKGNPELDFPKEFYENRLDIINQIQKRIDQEIKK